MATPVAFLAADGSSLKNNKASAKVVADAITLQVSVLAKWRFLLISRWLIFEFVCSKYTLDLNRNS